MRPAHIFYMEANLSKMLHLVQLANPNPNPYPNLVISPMQKMPLSLWLLQHLLVQLAAPGHFPHAKDVPLLVATAAFPAALPAKDGKHRSCALLLKTFSHVYWHTS